MRKVPEIADGVGLILQFRLNPVVLAAAVVITGPASQVIGGPKKSPKSFRSGT
jgi:hypothetical protein